MKLQMLHRKLEDKAALNRSLNKLGLIYASSADSTKMPNKKGQFYILIAIILIAFAIGIASSQSRTIKSKSVLSDLKNEFNQESPKVINTAILEQNATTNVTGRYDVFVKDFVAYAKSKNAMLDIIYMLSYDNTISVGNYYGEQITASQNGATTIVQSNQAATLSRTSSINITAGNYTYDFEIEPGANTHGLMRKGTEILII